MKGWFEEGYGTMQHVGRLDVMVTIARVIGRAIEEDRLLTEEEARLVLSRARDARLRIPIPPDPSLLPVLQHSTS
jgi:hypothetical protein